MKIFQTKQQLRARIQLLERTIKMQSDALQEMLDASTKLQQRAYLSDIRTEGRRNIFTFVRNGKIFQLETFSTLADNVPGWRKDLLE